MMSFGTRRVLHSLQRLGLARPGAAPQLASASTTFTSNASTTAPLHIASSSDRHDDAAQQQPSLPTITPVALPHELTAAHPSTRRAGERPPLALSYGLLPLALAEAAPTGGAAGAAGAAAAPPAALAAVLKVAPPACFFFLQVAPLKTIREIASSGSTGDYSILPFLSLATNCILWSTYGILKEDMTVLVPNASGALFGLYYTKVFMANHKGSLAKELAVGASLAGTAVAGALAMGVEAAPYIGYVGCGVAVFLMASPLATMATVIREKSTRAMPFAISLATFANATAWTAYGFLVANDPFIYYPNGLGFIAACVQLSLFARFGIHRETK